MNGIVRTALALVVASMVGACSGSGGTDAGDPGTDVDAAVPDTPTLDVPAQDNAIPDAAPQDNAIPDAATPDTPALDNTPPDAATPDTPTPGCAADADCPGCSLCDLNAAGGPACVNPFTTIGVQCTTRLDCPEQHCCSYSRLADRPLCGGVCVMDDGSADCASCVNEGMEFSGDTEACCPGLQRIPMPMMAGDSCIPSRCFCDTCVKRCGDGVCGTGEDACRCPADCPHGFAKGPGAPCTSDADCAAPGGCLTEASGYPTGGYCGGGACDPASAMSLCPAGSACTGTWFAQTTLCMPTCRKDDDCRAGFTCEAFPEPYAPAGTLRCWQAGGTQLAGVGQSCAQDTDCLSNMCLAAPDGAKVCSAFCDATTPCKQGQACSPMGGCGSPSCGACFTL